ncbi:hypothetical protein A3860_02970 [Niastella vici]|uniref:Uncharacterized protein n=1 Tax=Niastella vici TaxID=1703345 RepID=A0A1V9G9J2_9BACT|nr:hypothetical protein [Niastella vici]OQP67331.1 hypothetical protein A3860_02970 [Niastella vici]
MKIRRIYLVAIGIIAIPFLFALTLPANDELFFADNGQIRSFDNMHRILFRRDEDKMEMREYGSIIFSSGAVYGTEMERMRVDQDGNVCINTIDPKGYRLAVNGDALFTGKVGIGTDNPGSMQLAVEGRIGAREVQVTLQNPFPDYVFDSKYKLKSLNNLENYINQNKHLPGIPSAADVEKNGGIELGKMNTKLLEKIEELTLHVIELNKKIEKLEKEASIAK